MPRTTSNGIELYYDITGPEKAPVVVFSNSLGTTLEMWDEVVERLAGRWRCLRYDARGHGRSEVRDGPTTIEDLADDLAGLLRTLAIGKAHVVGLSIGGMTAQALALRTPAVVRSLSLLATTAHMPPPETWLERATLVRAEGTQALVEATIERWFSPAFREREPAKVARVRQAFVATSAIGYAVCCGAIAKLDLREEIGAVTVPTLIMAGSDDPSTPPAAAEAIRSRIANSELVILSGARHLLAVERPDAVAAHLSAFLDRQEARRAEGAPPDAFAAGLANRKAVHGVDYVERSLAGADAFSMPWQDFITRIAWGEVWGDPRLPWKTRSMLVLAMMVALHREEEFKLHLRSARRIGVTLEEVQALLLHCAIYAGVPASNAAFRWVKETLGEETA